MKHALGLITLIVTCAACFGAVESDAPSDPEQLVRQYLQALQTQDWDNAVLLLNTDALTRLASTLDLHLTLMVSADSLTALMSQYFPAGSVATNDQPTVTRISEDALRSYYPSATTYADLTSAQKVAAFLRYAYELNSGGISTELCLECGVEILGTVEESPSTVHVVVKRTLPPPLNFGGSADLYTVIRDGVTWQLWPGDALTELIHLRFSEYGFKVEN